METEPVRAPPELDAAFTLTSDLVPEVCVIRADGDERRVAGYIPRAGRSAIVEDDESDRAAGGPDIDGCRRDGEGACRSRSPVLLCERHGRRRARIGERDRARSRGPAVRGGRDDHFRTRVGGMRDGADREEWRVARHVPGARRAAFIGHDERGAAAGKADRYRCRNDAEQAALRV